MSGRQNNHCTNWTKPLWSNTLHHSISVWQCISALLNWDAAEFRLDVSMRFFIMSGETLGQIDQRGGRCPIPRNIQGQIGQGSEQPDSVEDLPAYFRGLGLDHI